jgi:TATA-binding protein-associated factor Taf7
MFVYKNVQEPDEMIENGKFFIYPEELKLQPHQIMGEASPYAEEEEESDLEDSEEDETNAHVHENKTHTQLKEDISSTLSTIWDKPETLEVISAELKILKKS